MHCSGRITALRPEAPSWIDVVLLIVGFSMVAAGIALFVLGLAAGGVAAIVVGAIVVVAGAYLHSD